MRPIKNWNQPCPNKACSDYGVLNKGNIKAASTYQTRNGRRRTFQCKTCDEMFSETRDTVFFDLKVPEEKVIMALKMFLVKVSLSNIHFVLGVKEETLLMWLDRAAQKAEDINRVLLKDLNVSRVELDEMWTFIKKKTLKTKRMNSANSGFGSVMLPSSD